MCFVGTCRQLAGSRSGFNFYNVNFSTAIFVHFCPLPWQKRKNQGSSSYYGRRSSQIHSWSSSFTVRSLSICFSVNFSGSVLIPMISYLLKFLSGTKNVISVQMSRWDFEIYFNFHLFNKFSPCFRSSHLKFFFTLCQCSTCSLTNDCTPPCGEDRSKIFSRLAFLKKNHSFYFLKS